MTKNFDFDLDDPLGDLLSDDSANDFFDEKFKRKDSDKLVEKAKDRSKIISDLFGIAEPKNQTVVPSQLGQETQEKKIEIPGSNRDLESPSPIVGSNKKASWLDFASTNKSVEDTSKIHNKQDIFDNDSILDDLLGKSLSKQNSKENDFDKPETKTATGSSIAFGGYAPTVKNDTISSEKNIMERNPSRRRRSSKNVLDPLGLFARKPVLDDDEEIPKKENKTTEPKPSDNKKSTDQDWLGINQEKTVKHVPNEPELPSWLGGSTATKTATKKSNEKTDLEKSKEPIQDTNKDREQQEPERVEQLQTNNENTVVNKFYENSMNLHSQQIIAMNALKQQESQILMAAKLRGQEEHMNFLQKRQQEVLMRQESHFQNLLEKQMQRQIELENNLRIQQDKINSHLEVLMAQPSVLPTATIPLSLQNSILDRTIEPVLKTDNDQTSQNKSEKEIKENLRAEMILEQEKLKMETEKMYLKDTLDAIKEKHNIEIDYLEESYKRQLSTIEQSRSDVEKRLLSENKNLTEFYESKVKMLLDDNLEMSKKYNNKLKSLEEEYQRDVDRLSEKHQKDLDNMKHEHQQIIDNIREAKQSEDTLVRESSTHAFKLKDATNLLEKSCEDLTQLNKSWEQTNAQREILLKNKEAEIKSMQENLMDLQNKYEVERSRMVEIVKNLENRLLESNRTLAEEKESLRTKEHILELKERDIERDRRALDDKCERDMQKLEAMKKEFVQEQERAMSRINEERKNIQSEKMRIETLAKLQNINDPRNNRAEIDAAINAANDAANIAQREKSKYLEKQRHLQMKAQELYEHERNLQLRASELNMALESAIHNRKASEKIIQAARQAEKDFLAKTRSVEDQVNLIREQESKIELEKQHLSKVRLDLMMIKKKIESKQCSLCKIGESIREKNNFQLRNNTKNPQNATNFRIGLDNNSDILQHGLDLNLQSDQFPSLNNPKVETFTLGNQSNLQNIGYPDNFNMTTNFTLGNILDSFEPTLDQNFAADLDPQFISKLNIETSGPTSFFDKSSLFSTRDLMHLESDNWLVGEFGPETTNLNFIKHLSNNAKSADINLGASTSANVQPDAKLEELYFNSNFNEMQKPERLDISPGEENKDNKNA